MSRLELNKIKYISRRINQTILSFPVWVILGVSGELRRKNKSQKGWKNSEKNTQFDKMY